MPVVTVVHVDDFYLSSELRQQTRPAPAGYGGAYDLQRFRDQVLSPILEDRPGRYQRLDSATDRLTEGHEVLADGIIVVEGVDATCARLGALYDYRVRVDCPRELRLVRGGATGR